MKTEADGRKVLALAKAKGADWNKLVTAWTQDTLTTANGGNLGSVTREGSFSGLGPQPALAESAMALGEGRIGGPWRSDRGWHVVKVDTYRPERDASVRPGAHVHRPPAHAAEAAGLLPVRAREGACPHRGQDRLDGGARVPEHEEVGARDVPEAQEAGGPEQRITAYRKVVEAWPEADLTPQAAFMVGFIYSEELKDYDRAEKAFRELLAKYPKSELTASAQWMVEHMRTEEAPNFIPWADSTAAAAAERARRSSVKIVEARVHGLVFDPEAAAARRRAARSRRRARAAHLDRARPRRWRSSGC